MITILGKVGIPSLETPAGVTRQTLIEILNSLESGKATLVECETPKQARTTQIMLTTFAEVKFERRGAIHTKRVETLIYVWPDQEKK